MKYQMSHTPVKYLLIISFRKHHIQRFIGLLLCPKINASTPQILHHRFHLPEHVVCK